MATITDKRLQHSSDGSLIDYFDADVQNAQEYYSFGSIIPGRTYSAGGKNYRYGFNSQEQDNEVSGTGNHNTAEFWEYDTRLGRRWNLDPVSKTWQSDYSSLSNDPINKIDPNGDDDYFNSQGKFVRHTNTNVNYIRVITDKGNLLLTDVNLNSATNRRTVANVAAYYANKIGIRTQNEGGMGIVGLQAAKSKSSEINPAFTNARTGDILINKKNNKIFSQFNVSDNIENSLLHEKIHKDLGIENGVNTFADHAVIYVQQIESKTFKKTTDNFKIGIIGSTAQFLLNARNGNERIAAEADGTVENLENRINNAIRPLGYELLFMRQGSSDTNSTYTIHNTKTNTTYEPIKYEQKKDPN